MEDNENPNYYRGNLITEFASLEKALDYYLCKYFIVGEGKVYEMMQIIMDRMTFENKRTALKTILDKRSEYLGFKKTNSKSRPSSKFLDELRQLNNERNIFAHYPLSSIQFKDSVICLLEFRDSSEIITYTKEKYDDVIGRIKKATSNILRDEMQSNKPYLN